MGSIELDPFSSEEANKTVKANKIYTAEDDALQISWMAVNTLWMNPPYSFGLANKAVDKLLEERNKFKQAIVLTNAATDTKWFENLRKSCNAVCLTVGRISFIDPNGNQIKGNTKGQAFFYFGNNTKKFKSKFKKVGWVIIK